LKLSRSTALVTDWSTRDSEALEYFARVEQSLADDWKLTLATGRIEFNTSYRVAPSYGAVDPVTLAGAFYYTADYYDYDITQSFYDAFIEGNFNLFGQNHEFVAGIDGQRSNRPNRSDGPGFPDGVDTSVDVFNADARQPSKPDGGTLHSGLDKERQQGLYAKTLISVTESLKLVVGTRYSDYQYDSTGYWTGYTHNEENSVFTPYGGLIYDLNDQWTAYFSVSDIYKSQADRLQGPLPGSSLNPIEGRSYEVGSKFSLNENKLTAQVALYRIERTGEASIDPTYGVTTRNGTACCYVDDGDVTSRGIDTEISGELWSGLQITAGYTYNDNENKIESIDYSSITPKHLFKLWADWRLPGIWSAWDVGLGLVIPPRSSVAQK